MDALLLYLALGACSGLLAGMFGIGGGLIIVPALLFIWKITGTDLPAAALMHTAIGSSLAAIVPTAVASIYGHQRRGAIDWSVWKRLVPGIVAGTAFGAWLAGQADSGFLRYFFAVFMLLAAIQIVFNIMPRSGAGRQPGLAGTAIAGAGIGIVSALVGIGGGTLTTPLLMYCGMHIRNAIATSAACGLPLAVTGAAGYIIMGNLAHSDLPLAAGGYVYWPAVIAIGALSVLTAPLGAQLTHTLPVALLKRLFAVLLAVVAIRLMLPL